VKLLLDTHILFWSLSEEQTKIPLSMLEALDDESNRLWVSSISPWEILMLAQKKKIEIDDSDPGMWIRKILSLTPIQEAPINHEVAIKSREIELPHQDPADRFIMATALVYDLVLMTIDQKLINSKYQENLFQNKIKMGSDQINQLK